MIYKKIPGWFNDGEAAALFKLASEVEGSILEIGHFYGRSTSCICEAIKQKNKKQKFVSYDMKFSNEIDHRKFYSKVMNYDESTGFVPPLYYDSFKKRKTTTEIAKENLLKYELHDYVDLISGNFIDLDKEEYDLIFCDATHDEKEVKTNLPHIIKRSKKKCIWAFHDMNTKLIKLVEHMSDCKFIFLVQNLGVFEFTK